MANSIEQLPIVFSGLCLLGLIAGSFVGVVIERLPERRSIIVGRSQCDHCGHTLGVGDLIPLASWAFSKGRCRHCRSYLGAFYPAIELAALAVVLWSATETAGWILVASCFLGWLLLAISVIDWRHFIIPNLLSALCLAEGIAIAALLGQATLIDALIGAVVGFVGLAAIAWLYQILRHREGLGFGDAKFLGALGAWVSWKGIPTVLLLASLVALLSVAARGIESGRVSGAHRVPFGTFLAFAGWIVWLYGPLVTFGG